MNIAQYIPDRTLRKETRVKEEVGIGNNSKLIFFLDYACVVAGSYTISYGATESSVTALTETTHYALDKDDGEITLTTAGKTAVGTSKIFAKYAYIDSGHNQIVTNTQLQEALDRAQSYIDNETYNMWVDGTGATPAWDQVLDEKHMGSGKHDRDYYALKFPIADVTTALDGDLAAEATTITVDSNNGFPETGYLSIGSNKIAYTGKDSTTGFTGCTGVEAHDDGDAVNSWVVEISTTSSGTTPTFTVLEKDADYDIDLDTGRVHIYVTDYDMTYYALQYPPRLIPNRFRMSYLHGNDSILDDINQLCLMIAARDLMRTTVRKGIASGTGDFNKTNVDIDAEWIQRKLDEYRNIRAFNI